MEQSSTPPTNLSAQERFFKYFQHEVIALQEQMEKVGNTPIIGGERKDATDHCLAGITRLAAEVKDASSTLPAYDVRSYTEAIKALQDKLSETTSTYAPKQKFAFKTKKNASAISITDAAEIAAQKQRAQPGLIAQSSTSTPGGSYPNTPMYMKTPPNETNSSIPPAPPPTREEAQPFSPPSDTSATALSNQTSRIFTIPPSSIKSNTAYQVTNIKHSIINISASPSPTTTSIHPSPSFASLTLTSITSTLLLLGRISGPTHITSVHNSTILLSTRQFRMHDCRNVTVYLHCTSRPIIESCHDITFTPLDPEILELFSATSGDKVENKWNQIDDFKWLKAEPSPNWSILESSDTISPDTWVDIIKATQYSPESETARGNDGEEARMLTEIMGKVGIEDGT